MIINNPRTNRCKAYFTSLILNDLNNFKVWVAGGSIRAWYAGEKISDIDLFFPSESERQKALNFIQGMGGVIVFSNQNVDKVSYNKKVFDFCKTTFEDPQATIDNFDYTIVTAAVTVEDSYFGTDFFQDLASKRLAFQGDPLNLPYPLNSLLRLQKYIRRGYWICKEELGKLVISIQAAPPIQPNASQEEIDELLQGPESDTIFVGMD